jgi:hypothetical protein
MAEQEATVTYKPCGLCKYHREHVLLMNTHTERLEKVEAKAEKESENVWTAILQRVTNKFFILLVALVVGGLGFQWVNYDKLSIIAKDVAVIQSQLTDHLKHSFKP